MGAFAGFSARAVEVGRIHRHGEQQRRYRKEGNELACARLTERVEHSARLTALIADGFDLDGGVFEAKPEGTRLFPKCAIQNRIVDLGHSPARAAHQELTAVLIFGSITTQERIQGVETMYESGFLKEFESSVNSGRGGLFAILGQFRQDLIGADGLVLAPDDLENAPSQRGQVYLPRCTHLFGRRNRALNASRVVMRRSLSVNHSRHTALFRAPILGRPRDALCGVYATVQRYTVTARWTIATGRDVITLHFPVSTLAEDLMSHAPGRLPVTVLSGMPVAAGPVRPGGVVRQMRPFAVGVFKGELWPKNQGHGAMHRSPQPIGRRVFVSLDEL